MKILFATNKIYLPQAIGGSEISTHQLCASLKNIGIKVAVLAEIGEGDLTWFFNRVKSKLFLNQDFPKNIYRGYPVYRGWKPVEGAEEVVRRFKPSVYFVQVGDSWIPVNKVMSLKIPVAIYFRDTQFTTCGYDFNKHRGLLVFANSKFTASKVFSAFGLKAKVIPPLVIPECYKVKIKRNNVIFINPIPRKGLDIACYLAEKRPDINFEFIESWRMNEEMRQQYKNRIARIQNIIWKSPVLNLSNIYKNAKLVILPSQWEEAWGRVATEAHINGIPVLAANVGGLPESVGEGGVLVNRDAPSEEWLETFSQIWDNHEKYQELSEAALKYSQRTEIQPSFILNEFITELKLHLNLSE